MTKEEMKKHTCCFTGHRRIPHEEMKRIQQQLTQCIFKRRIGENRILLNMNVLRKKLTR